jgi:hypothetical protein
MSFLPNDKMNNVNNENDLLQFVENENENENENEVLIENKNEMFLNENEKFLVNLSEQKPNFKKPRQKATDGLVA